MLWLIALLLSPRIRLLNFKIQSIDRALKTDHFNATQKLQLIDLRDELVLLRYAAILQDPLE